jgi:hypothetical protein
MGSLLRPPIFLLPQLPVLAVTGNMRFFLLFPASMCIIFCTVKTSRILYEDGKSFKWTSVKTTYHVIGDEVLSI